MYEDVWRKNQLEEEYSGCQVSVSGYCAFDDMMDVQNEMQDRMRHDVDWSLEGRMKSI